MKVGKVVVRIKEIQGYCYTMRVGDTFEVDDNGLLTLPKQKLLCIWPLSSILPIVTSKLGKGSLPKVPSEIICPDGKGRVIYDIQYID